MARTYSNAFVIGGLGQMLRQWAKSEFKQAPGELEDAGRRVSEQLLQKKKEKTL